ncbi:uroporphyrinogen decarboxylase family protein [Ramlibacter sp.]|uniref:uroporphyrinogen decarboxylase family protein n=1 Tax=Ramlibacter sp. TaxID=1917967 RepID=UPI003D124608
MTTKRARMDAAIRGDAVDKVPFGIWLHNFAEEYSDEVLAKETVRLYERFDFDFIKPQTRAHCFGEMWGQEMAPPKGRDDWPVTSKFAVNADGDLGNIRKVPANSGALAEQVRAYRRIRDVVGPDVHIIATVFSPMMNMTLMHKDGKPGALALQDSAPDALEAAFDGMTSTLEEYVALCRDAGVDGLFYATTTGNAGECTKEQFERFQRPFDDRILAAAKGCPMNVLHVCGPAIQAPWFKDHAANVYSWATTPGNPSLQDMHSLTGRAVMSGAPAKPKIAAMQPEELRAHVQRSLEEMKGRHHVLGPDCSINSNTSPELMDVIADTVRKFKPAAH